MPSKQAGPWPGLLRQPQPSNQQRISSYEWFRKRGQVRTAPEASGLAALNRKLLEGCRADESRVVSGQTERIGVRLLAEREHLLPLASKPLDPLKSAR